MKNAQSSFEELIDIFRRRKFALLIPIVIITVAGTVGALLMPKRYESSTTILVQGSGVLNPLVNYTMAVAMQSDDQLSNFNEIVYSTPIIEALIDSLGLRQGLRSEAQEQLLIKEVEKNIKTERNGSDSFTMSYFSSSPATAQRAVGVLATLFIQTKSQIENRKNNFAVQFFAQRLDSLRDKFEESQQQLVNAMRQHVTALPEGDRDMYSHIDDKDKQISAMETTVGNYQEALTILRRTLKKTEDPLDMKSLYEVPLLGVPYADQVQSALTKYDQLRRNYTDQYPDVQQARASVLQLLARTEEIVESDLVAKQNQIWDLEKERNTAIESVQEATTAQSQDQDIQSNFGIYKQLYNDMKIKLEQAQTNRALEANGERGYIVLDPPQLPTTPSKPNKPLMIGGGFSLGLIIGLFAAGLAEIFDSRVRSPKDIEIYNKPVVAYLPASGSYHKRAK
jgi:protein tyrosine kinase modulator